MLSLPIPHSPPDGWPGHCKTVADPTSAQSKPSAMGIVDEVSKKVVVRKAGDATRRKKKAAKQARQTATKTIRNERCAARPEVDSLARWVRTPHRKPCQRGSCRTVDGNAAMGVEWIASSGVQVEKAVAALQVQLQKAMIAAGICLPRSSF